MNNVTVAIAAIVMGGLVLSVAVWQLLAIARTAVAHRHDADTHERLAALEGLHHDSSGAGHTGRPA